MVNHCTCACHLPGTTISGEHACCGSENGHAAQRRPEPAPGRVSAVRPIVNELSAKAAPAMWRDKVAAARKALRR